MASLRAITAAKSTFDLADVHAEARARARDVRRARARDERLRGRAADVDARAARVASLDDHDALARRREPRRERHARLPRADDDQIRMVRGAAWRAR